MESVRPLKLDELREAISVEEDHVKRHFGIRNTTLLERLCGPLVRTDPNTKEITLAHFSLKEFLVSGILKETKAEKYHIDPSDASLYLAKTCLTYLSFQDFAQPWEASEELQKRRQEFRFLEYATLHGGMHLKKLTEANGKLTKLLDGLFVREIMREEIPHYLDRSEDDSPPLNLTISLYCPDDFSGDSISQRSLCPDDVLETLKERTSQETKKCRNGQSWLQLFRILSDSMYDHPANITSLYYASLFGWQAGVEAILQANCNRASTSDLNHALRAAAIGNHRAIIKVLEKHGAEVLAHSSGLGSALQSAAYCGNLEAVKTLMDLGATVEEEDRFYRPGLTDGSAFQAALMSGNKELVLLILLSKEVDLNSNRGWLGTPLQAIMEWGMDDKYDMARLLNMARLLIENGADASIPGGYYGSALHLLCQHGPEVYLDVLKLALEHGADPTRNFGAYGDPLQHASHYRSIKKVELLLQHGATVHASVGQFGTAIQAAATNGDERIVKALLERGADPNSPGSWLGKDAVTNTICLPDHGKALILSQGEGFHAHTSSGLEDGFFGPSIKSAVRIREADHHKIYMLLENEPAHENGHLGNPLQAASFSGNTDILRILIDKGAELNTIEGLYGTALQAAASQGNTEAVEYLIQNGALPNLQGGKYGTPLAAAIANGFPDVVRALYDNGADLFNPDEHGWTAETWRTLFCSTAIELPDHQDHPPECYLPGAWCTIGKSPSLELTESGLVVTYNGDNAGAFSDSLAASVITDHPVPPCGVYYFEVSVNEGSTGYVTTIRLQNEETTLSLD